MRRAFNDKRYTEFTCVVNLNERRSAWPQINRKIKLLETYIRRIKRYTVFVCVLMQFLFLLGILGKLGKQGWTKTLQTGEQRNKYSRLLWTTELLAFCQRWYILMTNYSVHLLKKSKTRCLMNKNKAKIIKIIIAINLQKKREHFNRIFYTLIIGWKGTLLSTGILMK